MPRKVLVAIGVSDLSQELLEYGHKIAHEMELKLDFIHVIERPSAPLRGFKTWIPEDVLKEAVKSYRYKVKKWLEQAEEKYPGIPPHEHQLFIEEGNPADEVIKKAKEGSYNLIIAGYRDDSPIKQMFVGSTTTNIARYAHCSVLIYRPGEMPL
jgi:nucleotide-binding universal stress UspA family protein